MAPTGTPWDTSLKAIIYDNAEDFVAWLLEGAQVRRKLLTEFQERKVIADVLLETVRHEQVVLLHIEIQSRGDPDMGMRLLEYNLLARRKHRQTVYSCVIYLRKDGNVLSSPMHWKLEDGQDILLFHFLNIELYNSRFA